VTRCSSRNRRRRHGALGFPNPLPCSAFQSLSGLHLGSVCTRSAWRAPGAIGLDPPWRVPLHRMRTVPSLIEGHACHRQGSHGNSLDNGCGVPDGEVGLPQLSMSEEVRMLPASTGRLKGSGSVRTRTISCPFGICACTSFRRPQGDRREFPNASRAHNAREINCLIRKPRSEAGIPCPNRRISSSL